MSNKQKIIFANNMTVPSKAIEIINERSEDEK